MSSVYEIITEKIIEHLERGDIPWHSPWDASQLMPRNLASGNTYNGINVLLLWAQAKHELYPTNYWLTYKQALRLGGNVRKGEKSSVVTFYRPVEKPSDGDGDEVEKFFVLRYYRVFNISQTEGIEEPEQPTSPSPPDVEQFIHATGAKVKVGTAAYYHPEQDTIVMPHVDTFASENHYWNVLCHELAHWTGAPGRLDRTCVEDEKTYAFEELVAEIGASFLCGHFGKPYARPQDARYIAGWLKVLKDDSRAIFRAASKATKACQFVLELIAEHGIDVEQKNVA